MFAERQEADIALKRCSELKMKILYITTIGITMIFFKTLVKELLDEGNIVDIATNESDSPVPDCYREWGCYIHNISTSRSPLSAGNRLAIKQIRELAHNYDIVHCHTPIAGMVARIACKKIRNDGLRVVYTAHGFHFYKGAPFKNWLLYYPIEKMCSKWTDVLITINKEDYSLAIKKMRAKSVEYIPGVGIDKEKFELQKVDLLRKREELHLPKKAKVILSVGELNKNKNHRIVIEALGKIKNKTYYYLIAGEGKEKDSLQKLALSLNVNLILLGYRKDVASLYRIADLYILPSFREGLNVSLMEAISSGCPAIASKIRGNIDLLPDSLCFNPHNSADIIHLLNSAISPVNLPDAFDYKHINSSIKSIYQKIML